MVPSPLRTPLNAHFFCHLAKIRPHNVRTSKSEDTQGSPLRGEDGQESQTHCAKRVFERLTEVLPRFRSPPESQLAVQPHGGPEHISVMATGSTNSEAESLVLLLEREAHGWQLGRNVLAPAGLGRSFASTFSYGL